jgi:putative membrane protein
MLYLKNILILAVALLHVYFLILEMFLWAKPKGLKTFRMTQEQANSTATLAANQGLYNGFLAAGLFWSLLSPNHDFSRQLAIFFLVCVIVAALYGGYSVGRKILYIQGLPALLALIALSFSSSV